MSDNAYRWVSVILLAATVFGILWTRYDVAELSERVAELSERVAELSEGHRELVSALVRE